MSSFEKVVKNACKPKPTPPKSKYVDPIIAATWSDDGAIHDVCKALSPRFREPNSIVVFKALIVLHMMVRNGATDNVLQYLSSSDVLRLKNVVAGQWEGYNTPKNLQHYAIYLDTRIRTYRDIKHDAIRVQSETNRDMRLSTSLEEDGRLARNHTFEDSSRKGQSSSGPTRSKTIMGRKLRIMTVEKGLLRETKVVQKLLDALVECRFYLDDLGDELTITALRMLVKDLLVLFQAVNEGVINVLEHYFEMSHVDAEQALSIYRHFCKQAEFVVEYLGVAKKLQNLLNVPIPNLKHAPISLVGALEEYLNDPNFEQNRIEYKSNKDAADKSLRNGRSNPKKAEKGSSTAKAPEATSEGSSKDASKAEPPKALTDFFSAIEDGTTIFNPQTGYPASDQFQQHATYNPFSVSGAFAGPANPAQPQPTGFLQPQFTVVPAAPQQPTNPFPGLQATPTGYLQPQATEANPFRASTVLPQATGYSPFGQGNPLQPAPTGVNPFSAQNGLGANAFSTNPFPTRSVSQPFSFASPNQPTLNTTAPAPTYIQNTTSVPSVPARPASTPLTQTKPSSPSLKPLKPHQTGSRNPFGVPKAPSPPPVPRAPTLFELAHGLPQNQPPPAQSPTQVMPQQTGAPTTTFTSVASSFLAGSSGSPPVPQLTTSFTALGGSGTSASTPTSTTTGSTFSDSLFASQPTGTTAFSSQPTGSPLRPQTTGYSAGIKAFKPTSSFGASLIDSLPPIPQQQSSPTTTSAPENPGFGGGNFNLNAQPTGFPGTAGTGSSLGVGLRPGANAGVANPFRASMLTPGSSGPGFGAGTFPAFGANNNATSPGASLFMQPTGAPSFGQNMFGGGLDASKQQNGAASFI
ncbi:ANTH domain-containing protein [Lactarius quietus]|nr:ANTH domain-containing protein [Lactarius quietus]